MKIREFFCENPRIIFILFYDVHKENMFTINLGGGREAPSKARKKGAKRLEFLVFVNYLFYRSWSAFVSFFPSDCPFFEKKKLGIYLILVFYIFLLLILMVSQLKNWQRSSIRCGTSINFINSMRFGPSLKPNLKYYACEILVFYVFNCSLEG